MCQKHSFQECISRARGKSWIADCALQQFCSRLAKHTHSPTHSGGGWRRARCAITLTLCGPRNGNMPDPPVCKSGHAYVLNRAHRARRSRWPEPLCCVRRLARQPASPGPVSAASESLARSERMIGHKACAREPSNLRRRRRLVRRACPWPTGRGTWSERERSPPLSREVQALLRTNASPLRLMLFVRSLAIGRQRRRPRPPRPAAMSLSRERQEKTTFMATRFTRAGFRTRASAY